MQKENEQHGDKFDKFDIFVNGKQNFWDDKTIKYSQVVSLAFPSTHGPNEIFTVQYSRGPRENYEGTLVNGQKVAVKKGMVFDVTRTDKS